jgi:hypothetical protein
MTTIPVRKLGRRRRHTDNDGADLTGGYRVGVSTGAQRPTEKLAWLQAALGQVECLDA